MSEANVTVNAPSTWITPPRFAALLALLILVLFGPVALGLKSFYIRDYGYFGYPLAFHHREAFWRGEIPLWNPLSCTGLPFLAQWNTLVLYPGSLIYLLLPLPVGLNLYLLAHQMLAGFAMFLLARRWTGSPFAAAAAGIAFAFNGLAFNCLMWPNNNAALGWMPLVVLFTERAVLEGRRMLLVSALLSALQLLTGAPEIILLTWIVNVAVLAGHSIKRWPAVFLPLLRAGAVVMLAACLAAAQLLPFLELVRASDRSAGFEGGGWAMPAWGWANFVLPLFGSYRSPAGVFFQQGQDWTSSYYMGIGVALLALWAMVSIRRPRVWLLGTLLLASLLLALGNNGYVYAWIRSLMPHLALMRFPVKLVVLAVFTSPLLMAFAIASIEERSIFARSGATAVFLAVAAGIAGLVVALTWFGQQHELFDRAVDPWRHALGRLAILFALIAVLWALMRRNASGFANARTGILLGSAFLLLLWVDAVSHAPSQNPVVSPEVFSPGLVSTTARLDPLPRPGVSRAFLTRKCHDEVYASMLADPVKDYLCHRLWMFGDVNLLDQIPLVDGFYSLYLREQREVWSWLFFAAPGQPMNGLKDFVGISQLSDEKNLFEWQSRRTALPLVTAGQKPLYADRTNTLRHLAADAFSPRREVYLTPGTSVGASEARATVSDQTFSAHRIAFSVSSDAPTLCVIAQSAYPAWRARVNGRPAALLRANLAFQAVEVPAGASHVELTYRDRMFAVGWIISTLALLACAALWRFWKPADPRS